MIDVENGKCLRLKLCLKLGEKPCFDSKIDNFSINIDDFIDIVDVGMNGFVIANKQKLILIDDDLKFTELYNNNNNNNIFRIDKIQNDFNLIFIWLDSTTIVLFDLKQKTISTTIKLDSNDDINMNNVNLFASIANENNIQLSLIHLKLTTFEYFETNFNKQSNNISIQLKQTSKSFNNNTISKAIIIDHNILWLFFKEKVVLTNFQTLKTIELEFLISNVIDVKYNDKIMIINNDNNELMLISSAQNRHDVCLRTIFV